MPISKEPGICRCGNTKNDPRVTPSYDYGFIGILALMFGVTPKPTRVDFKCGVCGETVETVKDKAELERFRYGPQTK
jgi:hypothetical protein